MLIAFNGPPGSGKTTALKILQRHYGVQPLILGAPFKNFLASSLDISTDDLERMKDENNVHPDTGGHYTYRDAQIGIANIVERFEPAVWVRKAVEDQYFCTTNVCVLDSVGKMPQWDWLTNNISDLYLWSFDDGDPTKISVQHPEYEVFRDGRHRVVDPGLDSSRVYAITNTTPARRTDTSLREFERHVQRTWDHLWEGRRNGQH